MILYHGTNACFDVIDLAKSNRYKDFGQGFYLTDIRSQAEDLAHKKSRLFGGIPVVYEYDFNEQSLNNGELRVLRFDAPTTEWAEFIFRNRNREIAFVHDYDIVIGPIADDKVGLQLWRYEIRSIDLPTLVRNLQYMKGVTIQYFFGTERAINILRRV